LKGDRMGMHPWRPSKARRAFPMMAPRARSHSVAFIACPGVGEVVSRSPISMREYCASTLQYTLPIKATGTLFSCENRLSSRTPWRYSPAPDTTPGNLFIVCVSAFAECTGLIDNHHCPRF
jgi:hypothetical protein